jgi:molybdenum cofactor sulfurtransferase
MLNSCATATNRNFSNQADYLLLSKASVEFLAERTKFDYEVLLRRFRANFIIETVGGIPFEEDHFEKIYIGSVPFQVTGKCVRCQMICVDQETGQKDPNVLLALRDIRTGDKVS